MIEKVEDAGVIDSNNMVVLHNGNKVPYVGNNSYYNNFSDILVINRGIHEPLEEFCFQELLKKINIDSPVMLELGSYWSHYSMWFLQKKINGISYMVEPDLQNMESGIFNFQTNGYTGNFINQSVGSINPIHNEINDKQTKDIGFNVDKFIDADKSLNDMKAKLSVTEVKIKTIEEFLKSLNNRNFSIKSAIDWQKMMNGIV